LNIHQKQALGQHILDMLSELLDKRFERHYEDVSFNIIVSYNPVNKEPEKKSKEIQDLTQLNDKVTAEELYEIHCLLKQYYAERKRIEQRKKGELSKI
jgi:hypothetical protein